ncbi:hypothetical protein ACIQXV_20080 [Neobacillus sp. NPDC097160]
MLASLEDGMDIFILGNRLEVNVHSTLQLISAIVKAQNYICS